MRTLVALLPLAVLAVPLSDGSLSGAPRLSDGSKPGIEVWVDRKPSEYIDTDVVPTDPSAPIEPASTKDALNDHNDGEDVPTVTSDVETISDADAVAKLTDDTSDVEAISDADAKPTDDDEVLSGSAQFPGLRGPGSAAGSRSGPSSHSPSDASWRHAFGKPSSPDEASPQPTPSPGGWRPYGPGRPLGRAARNIFGVPGWTSSPGMSREDIQREKREYYAKRQSALTCGRLTKLDFFETCHGKDQKNPELGTLPYHNNLNGKGPNDETDPPEIRFKNAGTTQWFWNGRGVTKKCGPEPRTRSAQLPVPLGCTQCTTAAAVLRVLQV